MKTHAGHGRTLGTRNRTPAKPPPKWGQRWENQAAIDRIKSTAARLGIKPGDVIQRATDEFCRNHEEAEEGTE